MHNFHGKVVSQNKQTLGKQWASLPVYNCLFSLIDIWTLDMICARIELSTILHRASCLCQLLQSVVWTLLFMLYCLGPRNSICFIFPFPFFVREGLLYIFIRKCFKIKRGQLVGYRTKYERVMLLLFFHPVLFVNNHFD